MLRAALLSVTLSSFALAPFQCAHKPDPNLRREDTAGDALWALAENFRARHNDLAARETLAYLVEKYPSSRYTSAAKEELARLDGPSAPSAATHASDASAPPP
ncbi:tol-pal system YbgF family protein [Pendulispora albinea]|uniref:Outer membrane lipoprotein BamD-like domain-containing protein n=1 Tax=Pendulispora albinea TaxID=2741071 RepID=A0ABZ2LK42_9BACT